MSTVLIFGSPAHPGLQLVAQALAERGRVKVTFLVQEAFMAHTQLSLSSDPSASSFLLEGGESLPFQQIRSVCLDGFYVPAGFNLEGMEPQDVEYIQTETWATLIAIFGQLSRSALVVNHVLERDALTSRWGMLRYLAHYGLPVPRTLVTSNPESLAAFQAQVGEVVFKAVGDATAEFVRLTPEYAARLDNLRLAPVHFEEAPRGEVCHCALVGDRHFVLPAQMQPPASLIQACRQALRQLEIHAGEVTLRQASQDRWLVTGMRQFPSQGLLLDTETREAMAELLEAGKPA